MPSPERSGPVEYSDGALRLGSASGHSVAITVDGLRPERAGSAAPAGAATEKQAFLPWDRVASIELDAPSSRLPFPAALGWAALLINLLLGEDGHADDAELRVRTHEGSEHAFRVTRHHMLGYPVRTLTAARVLLDAVVEDPTIRAELAEPALLLARLRALVRQRSA